MNLLWTFVFKTTQDQPIVISRIKMWAESPGDLGFYIFKNFLVKILITNSTLQCCQTCLTTLKISSNTCIIVSMLIIRELSLHKSRELIFQVLASGYISFASLFWFCWYLLSLIPLFSSLCRHKVVIVEGNYLLLEDGVWKEISSLFDEKWQVLVSLSLFIYIFPSTSNDWEIGC